MAAGGREKNLLSQQEKTMGSGLSPAMPILGSCWLALLAFELKIEQQNK